MKIAFLIPFVTFALAIINNTDDSLDGHGDVGFTPLIAFDTIPTGTPEHDKKKIFGTVWETIEQKLGSNLTKEEKEEVPNQMAPIEKALLIIRPKISERWVAREESIIKWAISNYLVSKANRIYMNCDLYLGKKMIMSVFKDVPFNIGTESWTPPVFLEPSPNYQLRLWSQPSQIGIIDEYSPEFMIVPRSDDAFMFNKPIQYNAANTTHTIKGTDLLRFNDTDEEPVYHPTIHMVQENKNMGKSVYSDSNIPTGIYALYPSSAVFNQPCLFWLTLILLIIKFL